MVQVRTAKVEDYPALSRLLRDCYQWLGQCEGLTPEQTAWLADHESSLEAIGRAAQTHTCYVAYLDGTLGGFIAMAGNHIDLLYVSPACRRQGAGRALFREAQYWVESEGYAELTLGAVAEAIPFYLAMGMAPAGAGHRADLIGRELFLMRKALARSEGMSKVSVDLALCTRCGMCVLTCSERIFVRNDPDAPPQVRNEARCIGCGHCVAICPQDAIRHRDFPKGSVHPLNPEMAPGTEQVFEMLRTRRSIRLFKDTPIEKHVIETILEGARLAPSAHNFQDTEYIVIQDPGLRGRMVAGLAAFYSKLARQMSNPLVRLLYRLTASKEEVADVVNFIPDFEMVAEEARTGGDPFMHAAPCVIVAHARRNLNFPEANAFLALHNATFVTQSLGLGGFLAGYLVVACQRDKRVRRLLGIPHNHQVYGALALGYPRFTYKKTIKRRPLRVTWR